MVEITQLVQEVGRGLLDLVSLELA